MASIEDRIGLIRTSTFDYAEDGTLLEAAFGSYSTRLSRFRPEL
jgi:hypothetical protein